jgi:hypothetical protein
VRRLLLALAAAELLYVAAFEWAARSGRLESWINRRPERLVVSFASAHSWFPCWGTVTGLELRGQAPRVRWRATVERGSGWLSPLPLLQRRLRLASASVSGVTLHLREAGAEEGPPGAARAALLPPLPALAPPPVPPRPVRPKWSFEAPRVALRHVREVWFEDLRLTGEIAGRAGAELRRGREIEIASSGISFAGLRLDSGGETLAEGLAGELEGSVAAWAYRETPPLEALAGVTGHVTFSGSMHGGALRRRFLPRQAWLELDDEPARFQGEVALAAGAFQPGSRVELPRARHEARCFGLRTAGDVTSTFAVVGAGAEARAELVARFDSYQVHRGELTEPDLAGTGLAVVARSSELDLRRLPAALVATIDLGEARLPDLAVFSSFIPPTVNLALLGGSGRASGTAEAHLADWSVRGSFLAEIEDARVRYGELDLTGRVRLAVEAASADVNTGRFDVAGSRFELVDFGSPQLMGVERAAEPGWWARIDVPEGTISMPPEPGAAGRIALQMRDSVPFIGLFETAHNLPRWIEGLLTVRDLQAGASFAYRPLEFALDDFAMRFKAWDLHARVRFGATRKAGVMMAEWKRLALGIRLEGERKKFKFVGVRDWYARVDLDRPLALDPTDREAFSEEALASATFIGVAPTPVSPADVAPEEAAEGASPAAPELALVPGSLALGDLDADGHDEGAVLLELRGAGGGAALYLAVVADRGGRAENLATRALAGPPAPRLRVEGGLLLVESAAPQEPAAHEAVPPGAASTPSTGALETVLQPVAVAAPACAAFRLAAGALVEAACPPPAPAAAPPG